jgi:hypothetical protein
VDKKEVQIKYCPTYIMLADYFTKALQGKLFTQLRDTIMGKISVFDLAEINSKLKERVEENILRNRKVSWSQYKTQKDDCGNSTQVEESQKSTSVRNSTYARQQTMTYAEALRGTDTSAAVPTRLE